MANNHLVVDDGDGPNPYQKYKKYRIIVEASKNTSYHIQIIKNKNSYSISEGVPLQITIPPNETVIADYSITSDKDF